MSELIFKMSPRNKPGSDSTSDGELGRFRKDSSTASQHSNDDSHDLPPIVGAPNSTVANRYAIESQSNCTQVQGQKENHHPGGILPLNIRSNSLYESRQSSPSLRRRLKVLIRQKSEPDMLVGRDLGLNSPRVRRMIAPSPPPGESPRSQSGSDCNSPRIIRKPRSFHGYSNSPRAAKSAESSPLIVRRAISTGPQSPITAQPPGGETIDGVRQVLSYSTGSRSEVPLTAKASGPSSPFAKRREVNLRKSASASRLDADFLPAVNGTTDGCVSQAMSSQESRRSFASDDDSPGYISMETVQDILYEHVPTEDRYGHTRGPHSTRKHQQTHQLQHDAQQHQQQESYHQHHHHHHHTQQPPQPHPPHQMPNGWVEKSAFADCSPPPTNSPTRELDNQEHSEIIRETFNNSYSSGSTERSKYEELSSEDKRLGNSLYDIEEAREQVDDVLDGVEEADSNKDNAEDDPQTKDGEHCDVVQTQTEAEENIEESKITDAKEKEPSVNGQNGYTDVDGGGNEEEGPGESGNEEDDEDDFSDDSYEESVPEYQKAPLSAKLRIKNWLAGLENSNNESSSRIDRFLPEIM